MAHPFSPSDDDMAGASNEQNSEQDRTDVPGEADQQAANNAEMIDPVDREPNDTDAQLADSTDQDAPEYDTNNAGEPTELDGIDPDSEPNDTDAIPPFAGQEIAGEDSDDDDTDGQDLDGDDRDEETDEELGDDESEDDLDSDDADGDDEDLGDDDLELEFDDDESDDGEESDDDNGDEDGDDDGDLDADDAGQVVSESRFSANVFLVGIPVSNSDDITLRALYTLQQVDVVVCEDFKSAARLLRNHNIAKKIIEINEQNQESAGNDVIGMIRAGKKVAILNAAGLPTLTAPGSSLGGKLRAMDVEPKLIPGVNAMISGLIASGVGADTFEYLGVLPRRSEDRAQAARALAKHTGALVTVESSFRLRSLLAALAEAMPERKAVLTMNISTPFEAIAKGTLAQLNASFSQKRFKGDLVIVIEALSQSEQRQVERLDRTAERFESDEDETEAPAEDGWRPIKKHAPAEHGRDAKRGSFGDRRPDAGERRGGFGDKREDGERRGGFDDDRRGGFGEKRRDDRPAGGFGGPRGGGGDRPRSGGFGGPRGGGGFGDRRRDDRPSGGFGDRRRDDRPGGGFGDRPRGDRPSGGFGGPRGGGDRPRGGDRPGGSFGDRPRGGSFGDRPRGGGFGDRPRGDRPGGSFGDRPRGDRPSGGFGGPRGGGGDRPRGGDRPGGGFGGPRGGGSSFGGPRGGFGEGRRDDRPGGDRPRGGGDRPGGFGDRPRGGGFGGPRGGGGDRPRGGFGGPRGGGPRGRGPGRS